MITDCVDGDNLALEHAAVDAGGRLAPAPLQVITLNDA